MSKSSTDKLTLLIPEAAYDAIEQLVAERRVLDKSFTKSDLVREAVELYLADKRPVPVTVQPRGGDRRSKEARRRETA